MVKLNPEGNILPVIIVGGAAAYFIWYAQKHKKSLAQSVSEHIPERVPHPEYAMIVPKTQEELDTVDEALCACYEEKQDFFGQEAATELVVTTLQLCAAKTLYSDFPWPPMSGDHPSVEKLWDIIEYRIRQLINDDELSALCSGLPGVLEAPGGEGGMPGEGGEGGEGEVGEPGQPGQPGGGQGQPGGGGQPGQVDPGQAQPGQVDPYVPPPPAYQPYQPPGGLAPVQKDQTIPGKPGQFKVPYYIPPAPKPFKFP